MSDPWKSLHEELQQWDEPAAFWWRDDDAVSETQELHQLVAIQQHHQLPLHLAAIPHDTEESLATVTNAAPNVWILQHGYDHQSHAKEQQRKIELGGDQSFEALLTKLSKGRIILQQQFTERYIDIIVPPWNRFNETALRAIEELGYLAISALGLNENTDKYMPRLNVHVDIIDWQQRRFAGTTACISNIVKQLEIRRNNRMLRLQPIGIMSHHLAHDQACWRFLSDLFHQTSNHNKIQWLQVEHMLALSKKKDGQSTQ